MWYLVCILIGVILGIILWEFIGVKDVYKGKFRFKQKGRGNTQQNKVDAELPEVKKRKDRERRRSKGR